MYLFVTVRVPGYTPWRATLTDEDQQATPTSPVLRARDGTVYHLHDLPAETTIELCSKQSQRPERYNFARRFGAPITTEKHD
jgi:hypothetical protein